VSAPYRLCGQRRSVAVLGCGAREVGLAVLNLIAAALLDAVPVRALGLLLLGLPRFVRRRLVALLMLSGAALVFPACWVIWAWDAAALVFCALPAGRISAL
jgi:hypothetical protein